jgi:hypothetical protein
MLCTLFLGQVSLETLLSRNDLLGMRATELNILGFRSVAPPICSYAPCALQTRRWALCRAGRTAARCGSNCDLYSTAEFILKHTILEEYRSIHHATTFFPILDKWRPPRSWHVTGHVVPRTAPHNGFTT